VETKQLPPSRAAEKSEEEKATYFLDNLFNGYDQRIRPHHKRNPVFGNLGHVLSNLVKNDKHCPKPNTFHNAFHLREFLEIYLSFFGFKVFLRFQLTLKGNGSRQMRNRILRKSNENPKCK